MWSRAQPTRRELVARGIAAGGLSGTPLVGSMLRAANALARAETDADVLRTLVAVELLMEFGYRQVLRSGTLSSRVSSVAGQLLGHEQEHARVLNRALRMAGGVQPAPPTDIAAADRQLGVLGASHSIAQLRTEQDAVRALSAIEAVAERAYFRALSKLAATGPLRTAATIMATEAQHSTVLIGLLYPGDASRAVPSSFVDGSS